MPGVLIFWLNFWPLEPPLRDFTTHSHNPLGDRTPGWEHSSVGASQRTRGACYRDALPVGVVVLFLRKSDWKTHSKKVEHGFCAPIPYGHKRAKITTKPVVERRASSESIGINGNDYR